MSVDIVGKKFSVTSHGNEERRFSRASSVKDSEAYAGIPTEVIHEDIEAEDGESQINLFEEDAKTQPPMGNWFSKLAAYTGGIEPTVDETKKLRERKTNTQQKRRLGTVLGVFLPCCQNIFGILLFLRVGWITGVAGALQSVIIVFMCCSCTMLTALSMSAIATNGKVPAGGSYFMISRSIGPEFGGAVGILFYLGNTIAAAMYLVGAVEVFLKYICPSASIFGDITENTALFNNTRVYGTVLLFLVMCCVLLGIKFVSRFATIGLAAVIVSIISVYLGVFVASPSRSPYVCVLGGRLLARDFIMFNGTVDCSKNVTGPIYYAYCGNPNTSTTESCNFFNNSTLEYYPAMPGLRSNKFYENFLSSYYRFAGEPYDKIDFPPKRRYGQNPNVADVTTSFMILLAIYFPSVTGIMAGSNRSGDLANPQVSIPLGTISAIIFTSSVYLSAPLLFAAVCDGAVMRDKFGESYGGGLLVASFAWPHYWVVLIGSFLSTIGAGLQSLTGSPRLLQAIAQDNVIPFLHWFKVTTRRGEPLRAQLLSYCLAQIGILIASIDSLTPLVTMFFLMCYGFVNLATMLNGFLNEPSWRPRFRFFHWFLSLIGLCLCIALMFISSWYYTIVAWVIAGAIYKYIEYRGASKEWGDATRGLQMSTARRAIIKLGDKPIHTKNWRPQILVYIPVDRNLQVRRDGLVDLVHQLKAGHGLTLLVSVLEGDLTARRDDVVTVKAKLNELIERHRIKGLADVLVAGSVGEGMKSMAQCAGLGQLRHNTIMMSFPEDWRTDCGQAGGTKLSQFMSTIRAAQACELAMLVPKGIDSFPRSKADQMEGAVHVWCIVHDGGLLLLTSYLLMRNRVWRKCDLCIFVVASVGDDVVNLKKDMVKFLYDLRINATVEVVALNTADISAYVAQRTASIEQRRQMMQQMKLAMSKAAQNDPQVILDQHRKSVTTLPGETVISVSAGDVSKEVFADAVIGETKETSSDSTEADDTGAPVTKTNRHAGVTFTLKPTDIQLPEHQHLMLNHSLPMLPLDLEGTNRQLNEFTFSPSHPLASAAVQQALASETDGDVGKTAEGETVDLVDTEEAAVPSQVPPAAGQDNHLPSKRIRRLHSASRLNELLLTYSSGAVLVIVNMPSPSRSRGSEYHYMDFMEALTEGLPRVLLVRGTGREVITAFSE